MYDDGLAPYTLPRAGGAVAAQQRAGTKLHLADAEHVTHDSDTELSDIEHPAMQRLALLKQLAVFDTLDTPEHRGVVAHVDGRLQQKGVGRLARILAVASPCTYFVTFFPLPCPNQTLANVLAALRRFVETVAAHHPGRPPVLYGNCQAGWAVTLLAADCEGLAGPTVLNGSPLSYWAGQSDVNPMRLAGGLLGGEWLTRLLADLGNGRLDVSSTS